MAKNKGNNKSNNQTQTVVRTTNSNNPSSNTRTVTQTRDANHWSNADYGSSFTKKDVKNLQSQGYNSNKIMKIAQMAYASGNVGKVNKTNQALYDLSSGSMRVGQNTSMRQGQETTNFYLPGRGGSVIGDSPKKFGWNGFGDSMSINRYGGGDSYTQTGVWSLPSKYRAAPSAGGGTSAGTEATGTTSTGTDAETLAPDYTPPTQQVADTQPEMPGMMSGGGAGINSAMNIRRAKSQAKRLGYSGQGAKQFSRDFMKIYSKINV